MKKIIQQADCFSVQLAKSIDKHNMDTGSILATIRLFDCDYSMAVELGECHSDMCGANGMLSAFISTSSIEDKDGRPHNRWREH